MEVKFRLPAQIKKGNFRIGQGLEINQTTSTISGRDFNRAIQANLTPLILALGG